MPAIDDHDLARWIHAHQEWSVEGGQLKRRFEAPTFLTAIAFVDAVAIAAEAAQHHPDIDIRWRVVSLALVTHDAENRITEKDLALAVECDRAFAALSPTDT